MASSTLSRTAGEAGLHSTKGQGVGAGPHRRPLSRGWWGRHSRGTAGGRYRSTDTELLVGAVQGASEQKLSEAPQLSWSSALPAQPRLPPVMRDLPHTRLCRGHRASGNGERAGQPVSLLCHTHVLQFQSVNNQTEDTFLTVLNNYKTNLQIQIGKTFPIGFP